MTCYSLDGIGPTLPDDGQFWIAPNASVIGNVILENNSSIWFGAVLRGDSEPLVLGENSNVQDNCVLHADPGFPVHVGPGVTVGHRAMVHGATIGEGSLIGIGAILLNGARIGRNCLVGAGALVPEGREVPDGSLALGAPAKVIRKLTDSDLQTLRRASEHYVRNWKRFAAGLAAVG